MVLIVKEESPMTKKLAVFDLDGTLSRTELFSVPAAQEMERLLGYPVQEASHIIASFGTNYKDTMDAIFPGWDQKAYDFYFTHGGEIQAKYLDRAMPYDGIPEAMDRLHAIGYETAVCSNSNIRYIKMCVSAIGLKDKMDYLQELEAGMDHKGQSLGKLLREVSPEKVVMVGDTLLDRQAAVDNQIPFIGCVYGFRPYEMEQVEHTAAHASELPRLIEGLLGE